MIAGIADIPGIKEVRGGAVLIWQKLSYALSVLTPTEGQEFDFGNTVTTTFTISGITDLQITSPSETQEFDFGTTVTTNFNIS